MANIAGFPGYAGWGQTEAEADFKATGGAGKGPSTSSPSQGASNNAASFQDVLGNAKQLQQYQVEQNQPAIQTLQGQSSDLQDRYSKLVDSIKGAGSVASNAQTLATNNELGARGILPSSGLYQQQQANAQLPVAAQTGGLLSQAGVSEQQDLGNLAGNIASLQAGNVPGALSGASSIMGLTQQASQFSQQQALAGSQLAFQQNYISVPGVGVYDTKSGQIINQLNGGGNSTGGIQYINGIPYVNK